jgi:hypothetical protein
MQRVQASNAPKSKTQKRKCTRDYLNVMREMKREF